MITKVEAKNYRCLKYISQTLSPFQILVGPNASGKTTFLDVVNFISDIVNKGIDEAIITRANTFQDLTWANKGGDIELAIECRIPDDVIQKMGENKDNVETIRYEIKFGIQEVSGEYAILGERVVIFKEVLDVEVENQFRLEFPSFPNAQSSIMSKKLQPPTYPYCKPIISKNPAKNDNFYPEIYKSRSGGSGWLPSFKLGHRKSSLASLPADETKFPASAWLKEFLNQSIQTLVLNSQKIREASRPGQGRKFISDGSNLPWVIEDLKKNNNSNFENWLSHIKTALPDIEHINILEFPDTKFKYLKITYDTGIEVPSWTASDGTLRLLALTLIAYLPEFKGIFLIEEPENGIHPKVMETVYQSLSSVYDAQILLATHSPVILSIADLKDVLCFAKTQSGITDIVKGNEHPMLRDWKGEANLSTLYASGVLG